MQIMSTLISPRTFALVLTITKDNVDELDHLSEYTSLVCLNCTGAGLTHLPQLPETLQMLLCGGDNKLNQLPLLPASLTMLECNDNYFPDAFRAIILNESPQNIRKHQLHEIKMQERTRTFRASCIRLTLTDATGELSHLSEYTSLTHLECFGCGLTSLPPLPDTLVYLGCGSNKLTELPPLPSGLQELYCHSNQLKRLPLLPDSLTILVCSGNPFTEWNPYTEYDIQVGVQGFTMQEINRIRAGQKMAKLETIEQYVDVPNPQTLQLIDINLDEIKAKLLPAALNGEKKLVLNVTLETPIQEIGKRSSQTATVEPVNQPQPLLNQLRELTSIRRNHIDIDDVKAKMLQAATNGARTLVYGEGKFYDDGIFHNNDYTNWYNSIETWFINEPECRVPYGKLSYGKPGVRFTWA
jgi:Leucine-rich repeat (LRR) protein